MYDYRDRDPDDGRWISSKYVHLGLNSAIPENFWEFFGSDDEEKTYNIYSNISLENFVKMCKDNDIYNIGKLTGYLKKNPALMEKYGYLKRVNENIEKELNGWVPYPRK